ncbi:hypothetical protein TELCIR_01877 [Teladorsagia circumcincta]|uniref:Uncharacterized protein n=1 Tax=Teladorsagia circumcincta TaxID=45464 RepID=A0A2G9V258_TELCI|nr:hypothetical protein TELCIR_01877 [Teladorsagia circumcincta]
MLALPEAERAQNGSRVFSGHVEIGFHPLVITSNDRLFSVKCIDNSYAISHQTVKNQERCIVDSELIGEIVYNSFMPKVFARARVFKFMNEEKYPPKCAFTKEEILNRYASKTKLDAIEDTFMTEKGRKAWPKEGAVVAKGFEGFYLSAVINEKMEEPKIQATPRHFLMGISYSSFCGAFLLYPDVSANGVINNVQLNDKEESHQYNEIKDVNEVQQQDNSGINHNGDYQPSSFTGIIAQLSLGADKSADLSAEVDQIVPPINENDINSIAKDKYTNLRDWRLDDRTINDTDIIPERQVACSNATIIASQRKCSWSGIEHLLVVWSFASLLVWIVMIGVCFYRQANKPAWVEFRERELQRMAQSRVLQHEHPWIHADAFEETRCKNKNELTMIQGTF